jgi:hypothetical protein
VKEPKTSIRIMLVTFTLAVGITVLDLLPGMRGLPWHGLYVIPVVWIALWSAEDDVVPITVMAWVVTLLALVRGFVSHETSATVPLPDRIIVIASIWLTVLLAVLRKRARRTFRWITLIGKR